jgi:nucleoside-diphosphate kinase
MLHLDAVTARRFYAVHEGKPFVDALVDYMSSGPSVAVALERENAVKALREFVGATDPAKAACGTIRHDFGLDIQRNSVHASDGLDTARDELRFFFEKL